MLNVLPLLLIILPVVSQLILGTFSIYKPSSLKFNRVSWINFILQIILSFVAFNIADYNFSKQYEQYPNPMRCGMPLVGMAVACFFLLFVLILIIVIQFLIKRWRVKEI
ncbi:hypothetical protein [Flavobacterium humidisoli]|uniref:Uncharacterized protein n=1 Tax=Flavobacterium humidisoli TaxID=2937442 RepID=A0ABY4LLP0_9FLAO|nr:hypothetical protein [Flavobacterium humidisoli]UPZ14016.1 hypothetical protein M0M44_14780 [Flavobacterium humidisoli]